MTKSRWLICSIMIGLLVGLSSSLFLHLLKILTEYRLANPSIIFLLPIIGFVIGLIYFKYGREVEGGNNLIISEIHFPQKIISKKMAPFILITTLLTHLFGGSAGREGTAVQMGSALADRLSNGFKEISANNRRVLLIAGAAAGFGSAIGAPMAGVIFGMEMLSIGRIKLFAFVQCFISSYVAYYLCRLLLTPHTVFANINVEMLNINFIFFAIVVGIVFGLLARLFIFITHQVEILNNKFIKYPPFRPFVAGCILVLFYRLEGSYQYVGLGLEYINLAFLEQSAMVVPFLKLLFTSLTVGSGFKGGEFIPLVYMGSTFGSFLSSIFPIPIKLLSALGFAAVFGAASNTPLACAIMAIELFGIEITIYAFVCCYIAYLFSGDRSIYKTQITIGGKFQIFKDILKFIHKPNH